MKAMEFPNSFNLNIVILSVAMYLLLNPSFCATDSQGMDSNGTMQYQGFH